MIRGLSVYMLILIAVFLLAGDCHAAQNGNLPVSNGRMAVVDTAALAEGIGEYKQEFDRLNTEFLPRLKEVETLKDKIIELENNLKAKGPYMDKEVLQQENDRYEMMKIDYTYKSEGYKFEYQKRSDKLLGPVRKKILDFMKTYSDSHNITATFDLAILTQSGLLLFNPQINITDEVIKEYNKKYPVVH